MTPSVGNFLLLIFHGRPADGGGSRPWLSAARFRAARVAGYGLSDCPGMTVGVEEANRGVVAALAAFMAGGRS